MWKAEGYKTVDLDYEDFQKTSHKILLNRLTHWVAPLGFLKQHTSNIAIKNSSQDVIIPFLFLRVLS